MKKTAIQLRQDNEKTSLVEQLRKTPIVQIACEKLNIARSTFYRWRQEDKLFDRQVEQAIAEGNLLVNDMAESQLMAAIRDQNMTAIIFWLKHHHTTYATRIELSGELRQKDDPLTKEQEEMIQQAIKHYSLPAADDKEDR